MPRMNIGSEVSTTGGVFSGGGAASYVGPYVRMSDNCGTAALSASGDLDWGGSAGTDCTTPGFGGAGNTHSSRSGFYELNKLIEIAQSQLPNNNWLKQQLTSVMNINQSCNAFFSPSQGTINFYRSSSQCGNTGELAAVFDHEWGHGLDYNDVVGSIAEPSGEGIADLYSALRLNDRYEHTRGRNVSRSPVAFSGRAHAVSFFSRRVCFFLRAAASGGDSSRMATATPGTMPANPSTGARA